MVKNTKGFTMSNDPLDPQGDPFGPPETPTEVSCLHCGETYDSYLIEWRIEEDAEGKPHGFWCCPTPGCDGKGFGFDIFPTDPEYQDDAAAGSLAMTRSSTRTSWTRTSRRKGRPTTARTTATAITAARPSATRKTFRSDLN